MTWRMGMAVLLAAMLLAGPAAAREAGEAMAVIIGNKSYKPGVPAVDFAHDDADAMKKWVVEVLGYGAEDVVDLRDATKTDLESWFGHQTNPRGKLAKWLRPGGEVVVYYSGHGIPGEDRRAYLLPSDADPDTAEINGYPLQVLVGNMAQLQARSVTVFLDACFSGLTPSGPLAKNTRAFGHRPNPTKVMGNVMVLSAGKDTQTASSDEQVGHGLFTEYLLRAVYGEADKTRWGNGDGKVTLEEVKKYLDSEMTYRASRALSREQTADLTGDDAGRVVVAWTPGKPPVRPGGGQRADFPPGKVFRDCADCPEMVVVPAGTFTMGSSATESERSDAEGPQHRVTIAKPFAVGKYEVTQAEWQAVMGNDPSHFKGARNPVEQVSWDDAQEFIRRLNAKVRSATRVSTGGDGPYRLLTEAEWEYVARAGTTGPYWWGSSASHDYANYGKDACCDGLAAGRDQWVNTSPVGSFPANGFGLHDLHGNVLEWVEDCWHGNYNGAPENGAAWTAGECRNRVLRGGSWIVNPRSLRSALRDYYVPVFRDSDFGLRLARTF